jgi:hypothetical protein
MVYRRFGYIQSRLLLDKQDELRKLEQELGDFDQQVQRQRPANLTTRDLGPSDAASRVQLMNKVARSFREFGMYDVK